MSRMFKAGFLVLSFIVCMTALPSETRLRIKGESLTPSGDKVSLEWQIERQQNSYLFYLNYRQKAEMVIAHGKVVKIRRRVRFAGREKWITLKDPLQIKMELKSGFYPFSAVLNYRKDSSIKTTVMSTGRFIIEASSLK